MDPSVGPAKLHAHALSEAAGRRAIEKDQCVISRIHRRLAVENSRRNLEDLRKVGGIAGARLPDRHLDLIESLMIRCCPIQMPNRAVVANQVVVTAKLASAEAIP